MSQLRKVSGKECVKILCNKFGFQLLRQRGSHVILKKEMPGGKHIGTVIPIHDQLKIGTLKGILQQVNIDEEEFTKYI